MLTAASAWLAGRLLGKAGPWLLAGAAAALVAVSGFAGVQSYRLLQEQAAHQATKHDLAMYRLNQTVQSLTLLAHGNQVDMTIYAEYVHETNEQAPAVERVVERTRNICVRDKAPGTGNHLPLQTPAGRVARSGVRDEDAADRAFAEAIPEDLAGCAPELVRLRKILEHDERMATLYGDPDD